MQCCTLKAGLHSRVKCKLFWLHRRFLCAEFGLFMYFFLPFWILWAKLLVIHHVIFHHFVSNQRNECIDFLCDCVCLSPGVTLWSVDVRVLNLQQSSLRSFSNCTKHMLTASTLFWVNTNLYVNVDVSVWQALSRPASQMQSWLRHWTHMEKVNIFQV